MRTVVFFFLLWTCGLIAQEAEKSKEFRFEPNCRLFAFYPMQFGNHALVDAYSAQAGFGINAGFLSYGDFNLFAGWETTDYKVSDQSKIANDILKSGYFSFYGGIDYKLPVGKKFTLKPTVGAGYARLKLHTSESRFGNQNGMEFRGGTGLHFSVSKSVSVYLAGNLILNTFNVNTYPDYESYYGRAKQVQLSVGIEFH